MMTANKNNKRLMRHTPQIAACKRQIQTLCIVNAMCTWNKPITDDDLHWKQKGRH